ncbi:MAG: hypothetical protein KKF27_20815 [Gammaproteobacteria bacterium]|nr:hypothetical protein [Gammaproteobacteria bacterium]MBU2685692.1 hypothetical protein [Gammaproteobacteria bacterium]
MSTTRAALRRKIDVRLRTILGAVTATRTATGGSTTTVVDSARTESDDYWNNCWLFIVSTSDGLAPQGEEMQVTDYSGSTDTFTVAPAFSAAVGNTDTYEVRRYYPASAIHAAINEAIEEAQNVFPNYTEDETLVVKSDINEFTLPSTISDILNVDMLVYKVESQGTATSGAATSLTDTGKSWTVDALIGMYVTIYDGTGAGQLRAITDNTATAITVATWTTNPDSTSQYKILDFSESPVVERLSHVSYIGTNMRIEDTLDDGQILRVTHIPVHADLATEAVTTAVPDTWTVNRALYHLLSMTPITLPSDDLARRAMAAGREAWDVAERFRLQNQRSKSRSYWGRGHTVRRSWWKRTGPMIGTREEV